MRFCTLLFIYLISTSLAAQTVRWNSNQTPRSVSAYNASSQAEQRGFAVYYADYYAGNPTALGEVYDPSLMTAAHKTLPLGTIVKVTRQDNGLSTTVRINDRGPYSEGCVIDLSKAAAMEIDLLRVGKTQVYLTVLGQSNQNPSPRSAVTTPYPQQARPAVYNSPTATTNTQQARSPQAYEYVPVRRTATPAPTQQARSVATPPAGVRPSGEVAILASPISAYAVQLGSYGNFANAERHVVSLQERGFNGVFVYQETSRSGEQLNRVIIAPFGSSSEANTYLQDLRNYQQMDGLVVRMR